MESYEAISIIGLEQGIDFKVITETEFKTESLGHVFYVGENVSRDLAVKLGMGVIEDLQCDDQYIYSVYFDDSDDASYDKYLTDEKVKVSSYNMIVGNIKFDKELYNLFQTDAGKKYIKSIVNPQHGEEIIQLIEESFKSVEKGKVLEFKPKES